MEIMDFNLSFDMMEKTMNLPPGVKLVSIVEGEYRTIRFRLVSDLPSNAKEGHYISVQNLSDLGDTFINPEKYYVPAKGQSAG